MVLKSALLATACSVRKSLPQLFLVFALVALGLLGSGWAQTNVLTYLELRDIGATPAEIILSPDFQTIIEFEGMTVESASSGRTDQITAQPDGETVRLRANQETVNTDLTVMVAGRTALFILRSDPTSNSPRRYVVRNSPPPVAAGLSYQGIEGRFDLNSLVGTNDLPPGVSLDLTARMDNKGDVTLYYTLANDGEVAIVNEPSRLYILNEDITLKKTISRVPPAGSVNVIRPGNAESGVIVVPNPPNGQLTFAWVLVQLGPGGEYNAIVDVSALLKAPVGTTATVGTPATEETTVPAEPAPQSTEAATTTPAEGAPASPIPVDTALQSAGVTVYEHGDFTGASVLLAGADGSFSFYRADQGQFGAVADNRVSSLVVPVGYSVLLCDVQATFPCEQYSSGSHTVKPELNDMFSFAQVSRLPIMATNPASSETATTTPSPATAPAPLLAANFDTDNQAWELRADQGTGGKAQGDVTDGQYCVAVEASGTQLWSVQFINPNDLTLEAGHTYQIDFDAKADIVNGLVVNVTEGAEPYTSYLYELLQIDAGSQHFSYTFAMTETKSNVRTSFLMGEKISQAPSNICLDNVTLQDVTQAGEAAEVQDPSATLETTPETAPDTITEGAVTPNTQANSVVDPGFDKQLSDPWSFGVIENTVARAQGAVTDGRFCTTIEAMSPDDPYLIRLGQSGFGLDPSLSYTLSFDYQANKAASFLVAYQRNAETAPWTEYFRQDVTATTDVQRFEQTFTSTEAEPQTSINFYFGTTEAGTTVCLDNVSLTVTPNPESQTQPAQDQAEQAASTEAAPDLAGTYSLAAAHSGLCVDVTRFNQDNGAAIVQWDCNDEINQRWTLEPHEDYYKVVAEHSNKCLDVDSASVDDGHKVHQWECAGVENQLWSVKQVASGYQLIAKHSGKCLVVQDGSLETGAGLIQWSCTGGEQATNDVFALNPSEPAPDAPAAVDPSADAETASDPATQAPLTVGDNLVANGSFDDSLSVAWESHFLEGARGVAKVINGEHCFNILDAGPASQSTRLIQFGLPLEAEQTYVLSFEAYADEVRTIRAHVAQNVEPWTLHHSEYFTLQETKQIYTMTLKVPATPDPTSYLEFAMGGNIGSNPPFRVCFDNVSVKKAEVGTEASTPNVIGNPSFDDTAGSLWYGFFHAEGGSQGVSAINNGEFCMKVTNGGTEVWGVQLGQREFPLEANQTYTLSFEAYADQPHTIYTTVNQSYEPYGGFHKQDFAVGQEKQSYTTSFTMPASGETNSGLEFWMGGDLATNPPFTVCLDNIVITESNVTTAQ
jgi:hypothetical protein